VTIRDTVNSERLHGKKGAGPPCSMAAQAQPRPAGGFSSHAPRQARIFTATAGSSCPMRKSSDHLLLRSNDRGACERWIDGMTLPVSRLLAVYDTLGCGAALVWADGSVLAANEAATRTLRAMLGAAAHQARPARMPARLRAMLKHQATTPVFLNLGKARPCVAQRVSLSDDERHFLVLIADLNTLTGARADLLEHGFGLTACEARVAVALSTGMTPTEIAKHHGISMGTVRSQLKSIFVKTGTRRQPELIAVLARLLPFAGARGAGAEREGVYYFFGLPIATNHLTT
jgi:DNA-binding CsgD family transcriptional regulator